MGADLIDVDELLRNGANPNLGHREDQGLTPIHFAARFGNVELLKMLKRAGGDPGITNALGLTPLSYTCAFKLSLSKNGDDSWERQQVAAIKWLLGQGANPNHVDKAGYTPLAWACRSGIFPAVVALVEAGADVMQRRPELPGGSHVRLPKADPLAVTTVKQIERYVQNKINTILLREGALLRRECKVDLRSRRLKEIQAAIARKKEARAFVIQEKQRMKQTEELSLELMKVDKAEEARKARRDWLRLMKVSPGIWVKVEGAASAGTPGVRARKPRPRWVFDTSTAVSKSEAKAHGVLEEDATTTKRRSR
ncbi:similar to ankyrin 2,3/unc44 [Ectocarpus siliculosus]|uniref:Similar to ankyrin 2,3/unc44 n=1 Tax=Ectocarpus siliculosus TaxID=2880 RepID=D8LHY1_ECTSI|nr:similar to ankyrin 2,3/unc44 [Ectocarpus siliculosus]|eukprot:CBN74412.1 similar to ankyrin 2,3/unc44 [Ectocarpus siliculosus]